MRPVKVARAKFQSKDLVKPLTWNIEVGNNVGSRQVKNRKIDCKVET